MKFKPFILKTFNLKQEELPIFSLLFFHSFFLVGVFISFYFVPANSVFISHFGSDKLPLAYITAGAMGYLTSSLYSRIQKKAKSRNLFLGALSLMGFIPLVIRIGLLFSGSAIIFSEKWLAFFAFIWAWPFISLSAIESGGLALRLLDLRQVKRLFGPISIGGILASIVSYFTVPLFLKYLTHPFDLFYIGIAGIIVAIILLLRLYKKFPESEKQMDKKTEKQLKEDTFGLKNFFQERYFILIFIAAVLSMLTLYFSDFAYLSSIRAQDQLLDTPEKVSSFIALICGGFKVGELILSYFSSRILSSKGVKLGLTILPIVSTSLIVFATITGLFAGATSLAFFGFIVVNKMMERILRRGLDDPSFNILYQPLPEDQKLSVQTQVGVVMQMAIGIAGLLLLAVSEILYTDEGFQLKYFTLFFLPILFTWSLVAKKLYDSYREKLREILEERNRRKEKDAYEDIYGNDMLSKQLISEDMEYVRLSATILSQTNPGLLENYAVFLLESESKTITKAVLRNIDPTWHEDIKSTIKELLKTTDNEEIEELAQFAYNNLDYSNLKQLNKEQIKSLPRVAESATLNSKMDIIKFVHKNDLPENDEIIAKLLEDNDKRVKQAAIRLIKKNNFIKLKPQLIELLKSPEYYHTVGRTLVKLGDDILPELNIFLKATESEDVFIKIVEVLARIGTSDAQKILLEYLSYPNKTIQVAVIDGLYYTHFQASDKQKNVIKQKIQKVTGNILWLYACINDVESEKNTLKLIQSLDIDREKTFDILFKLLSFIYQPATIDLIKTNLIGENTIFALEIIDNFLQQDVKQFIIPLVDNISIGQRIKKLQQYFPGLELKLKFTERLKNIIVSDFDMIDPWNIAKTIELMGKLQKRKKNIEMKSSGAGESNDIEVWTTEAVHKVLGKIRKSEMPDEVFVCLYHRDEIVYSTAAKVIYDENPRRCYDYLKKLSPKKKALFDILSDKKLSSKELLVEKVKQLKRLPIFFSIPENILSKLAKLVRILDLSKGESIDFNSREFTNDVFIVLRGSVQTVIEDSYIQEFRKHDIIVKGLNIRYDTKTIIAKRNTMLISANRYEYFNFLIDENEVVGHIFEGIKGFEV